MRRPEEEGPERSKRASNGGMITGPPGKGEEEKGPEGDGGRGSSSTRWYGQVERERKGSEGEESCR